MVRTAPANECSTERAVPAGRPAFSILEVLVALTLVVLVAGLVIPISIGAITRASAEEAQPRLEAAVTEARLEASRLSVPVRLVAAAGGRLVRIERLLIEEAADGEGGGFGLSVGLDVDAGLDAAEPDASEASWAHLNEVHMPDGIVLEQEATESGFGATGAAALGVFTMSESAEANADAGDPLEGSDEAWVIATALPDGRLEPGPQGVVVRLGRGAASSRRWRVRFSAWTGRVALAEMREEDVGAPSDEELPPPPPPADAVAGGGR